MPNQSGSFPKLKSEKEEADWYETRCLAAVERVKGGTPEVLPVRASLGRALMTVNRAAGAVPHLEAALPTDRDGSLHFQLSRALQGTSQTERVAQLVKKSQELRRLIDEAEQTGEITPPK